MEFPVKYYFKLLSFLYQLAFQKCFYHIVFLSTMYDKDCPPTLSPNLELSLLYIFANLMFKKWRYISIFFKVY